MPTPNPYVYLTGTVTHGGYSGGDILVFTSVGGPNGIQYYSATLPAPGPFSLRAPANTNNVVVWAVADENADGLYDLDDDPYDATSVMSTGTGPVSGLVLDLVDPLDNSISGLITYTGAVDAGDQLWVSLNTDPNFGGNPADFIIIPSPSFPAAYSFTDLPAGTYWMVAFLDYGSDSGGPVAPNEPWGTYGAPIVLSGGSHPTSASFPVVDP